jgi:hypothetical protein
MKSEEQRKKDDAKILKMYGFKSNPFELQHNTQFSKDFSKLIVKNELPLGVFRIQLREPEQSTFKIDLEQVLPERNNKIKQIRIELTKRDFEISFGSLFEQKFQEGKQKLWDDIMSHNVSFIQARIGELKKRHNLR